jgi:multimeric flavodoxin WrbA
MKIGIIVYSLSGHTLTVAESLKEKLAADGHAVTLERVETTGPAKVQYENAELKSSPAVDAYEALVFACPVRGGTIPAPMKTYLEQLPSLQGKQVACFVTHFFQREWGANQVLAALRELCESKGATVLGVNEVRWFSLRRKERIAGMVGELSGVF